MYDNFIHNPFAFTTLGFGRSLNTPPSFQVKTSFPAKYSTEDKLIGWREGVIGNYSAVLEIRAKRYSSESSTIVLDREAVIALHEWCDAWIRTTREEDKEIESQRQKQSIEIKLEEARKHVAALEKLLAQ